MASPLGRAEGVERLRRRDGVVAIERVRQQDAVGLLVVLRIVGRSRMLDFPIAPSSIRATSTRRRYRSCSTTCSIVSGTIGPRSPRTMFGLLQRAVPNRRPIGHHPRLPEMERDTRLAGAARQQDRGIVDAAGTQVVAHGDQELATFDSPTSRCTWRTVAGPFCSTCSRHRLTIRASVENRCSVLSEKLTGICPRGRIHAPTKFALLRRRTTVRSSIF